MNKEDVALALRRAQGELEQALAALETMPAVDPKVTASCAHALNNYLTITEVTVDLLLSTLGDYPDPQVHIWLQGLRHAAQLMNHTTSQLMTAGGQAKVELRFEAVNLAMMMERGRTYYQRLAQPKQISIVGLMQAVPPVWADRVVLAAVLDNLLSNAVKFSEPGKRIWVEVRAEEKSGVCSVRDEGPGLSEEDQAKLFQKGVRLTPEPTGGEPSSGFGLAMAKELVDQLGGELWCESRLGQGSCFSLRLPLFDPKLHSPESG